ncbi:alpha/beta hydrolase [Lujinxingia vulgaris]|nr:alpha/beta fold hydrolase [Lujinxingia vulgaris]
MSTSILEHPRITRSYFFPRADTPDEIFFVNSGDARLACAYHVHDPEAHTLVHFHGNGEVVADYIPWMADLLAGFGLNSFFVEYRGYGGSTGCPGLVSMLDDVDAVVDAIDQPVERIFAFGRSVGSLYALELAHRHPEIAGLVLESGIADVLERVLLRVSPSDLNTTFDDVQRETRRYFNHEAKLADFRKPLLIMHALRDHLVDVSHARRMHAWSSSYQKRLAIFEQGDHNSIFEANRTEYLRDLRLFLTLHARQR